VLHINHFTYGPLTPVLAYLMSVIGSLLGLQCAARARGGGSRAGWLSAAAVALGGTGIWVMHFIAMLGFSINDGVKVRFDVPLTLISAVVAVLVVGIGLFAVSLPAEPSILALLVGGTITGSGVAAMHYTGMAAMRTDAHIDYDPKIVGISVAIAIVASVAALWFTLRVRGLPATIGAALIMGVAVTGMHYTGMAAMSAHSLSEPFTPAGAGALELLTPLIVIVSVVTTVLLMGVATTETEDDDLLPAPRFVDDSGFDALGQASEPSRFSRRAPRPFD
jgi:NO-binding membrane sensor protein with MHYT domain